MASDPKENSMSSGLRRVALDLHVHTPASHDWTGGEVTPEQFVQAALDKGLDGIAITDHQTGDWIDRIKAAAEGNGLTIFPGVEVDGLAGNAGIHLIVLFTTDASSDDVEGFLRAIGAVTGTGKNRKRKTPSKGLIEVLDEVLKYEGIAVLAHCQSSKGVLSEMRGDVRTEVIKHPAVLAAEAPASDFFDSEKAVQKKRTFDRLDGSDVAYPSKLAVFQASDNPSTSGHGHSLEGIGSRYSYFEVEEPIELESLRQCFVDREARVSYPSETETEPFGESHAEFPRIVSIRVTGGFLDELELPLHAGMTTLLGAKGSGKSLLVELIRFALDQAPSQPEIAKEHEAKLAKRLGNYGRVTLVVSDATGHERTVTRTFSPAEGHPYEDDSVDVAAIFPCHLLSQGEIVRLAESEDEQIKFIDSFFDFRSHQRAIVEVREKLAELDRQVAQQMRARKAEASAKRELDTLIAQIAVIDGKLKSPVFEKYRTAQLKNQAVDGVQRTVEEIRETISACETALEGIVDPVPEQEVSEDPLVRRSLDVGINARKEIERLLKEARESLDTADHEVVEDRKAWDGEYAKVEEQYKQNVKAGGDTARLTQERAKLQGQRTAVEGKHRQAQLSANQLKPTVQSRNATLAELDGLEAAYTETRKQRCEWFFENSEQKIKASVQVSADYRAFKEQLEAMKRGSYLGATEIERLAKSVTPKDFVRAILNYDYVGQQSLLQDVAKDSELELEQVVRLADLLLAQNEYEALLAMEYTVTPTDRPEIFFRGVDGEYAALSDLSTGQKCTAFLVMMLCDGEIPIVVDQPEDSLDIRSIWDDMCTRLRTSKRNRQFVFTTHNSSLAVASDTDMYAVLVADGKRGEIAMSGAIDGESVRKEVIDLLEGGAETYFLKQRKYNM